MVTKHRVVSDGETAAQQHYGNFHSTTRSSSLRHEQFGLETFHARLGRPNIVFKLWDGFTAGSYENSIGTVTFKNRLVLYQLLFSGEIAFCDGYSEGAIDIEGNLVDILVDANVNRHSREAVTGPFQKLFLTGFLRSKTLRDAKKNIHHHYDIGNEFYQLWLDDEMQYTCGYFPEIGLTLEGAQLAKMDHVCRKLQLQPGDKVVEAGCGWGGLSRHMVKYYGAHVTAYNISQEQIRYGSDRARAEGYSDQIRYVEDDYRNIDGTFDVFVSVGMLEHVGKEQYQTLGNVVEASLTEEGRALIHTIGRNVSRPMSPWIDRRIFPGAYPPTLREIMEILEPNRFSVLDVENLRLHYARTLEHWLQRFESSNLEVVEMFDERFIRAWRLYLSGSIAAFLTGGLQLFQVVFSRERNNEIPWSREHLY
jgi:cyclopropane-fatty-acyl-phospholipid synthase